MAPDGPLTAPAVAQVIFVLLLLCGFILLCAWLYRRLGGVVVNSQGSIRLLASMSMGGRDRLAIIQAGDKQILLGMSPGRINKLHVFDEPVITPDETGTHPAFNTLLMSRLKKAGQVKQEQSE